MKSLRKRHITRVDVTSLAFSNLCEVLPHVSRGVILSGVLQGTAGYDSVPVMTDTPVSDSEPDIDYNPETDQRLDRFDAVEMGIDEIDNKTPTRLPSGVAGDEKKE